MHDSSTIDFMDSIMGGWKARCLKIAEHFLDTAFDGPSYKYEEAIDFIKAQNLKIFRNLEGYHRVTGGE